MTRTSSALSLTMLLFIGCTSDQLGYRPTYRDRNVMPWANPQPTSNPPVALQPNAPQIAMAQPGVNSQALVTTPAFVRQSSSTFPMIASAGGQIDGRAYPLMNREVSLPRKGGARSRKRAIRTAANVENSAIVGGLGATPGEDLRYRGGHTIKDLKFMNIYIGGAKAWNADDYKNIDKSIAAAMSDERLNNVVMQYFNNQPISATFLGSSFLDGWSPKLVQKNDLEAQIIALYRRNAFNGFDLPNTVFNFILPRGSILGDPSGGAQEVVSNKAIPHEEAEDSTGGLGGYHGSAHVDGKTIYYSADVFSERLPNGSTNGIPVFQPSWKNVVATLYHELHEARTDPDVDDAMTSPLGAAVLGWTSDSGNEIGDYPIAEAKQLTQVFQEVPLADGSGTVPVQFNYSNAVHGPEGPIDYPHGMEQSGPPPNKPVPQKPNNPSNGNSGSIAPELQDLISNWNQLEDYVKKAILKLAS